MQKIANGIYFCRNHHGIHVLVTAINWFLHLQFINLSSTLHRGYVKQHFDFIISSCDALIYTVVLIEFSVTYYTESLARSLQARILGVYSMSQF